MTGEEHRRIVVDASAVLAAYLPDEATREAQLLMQEYALGELELWAPRLLLLELLNACLVARKRKRLDDTLLGDLAAQFLGLDVRWVGVEENAERVFKLAREHGLTAYDAAYVAAAEILGCRLVTGDRRLHNAVKEKLPFVVFLADYQKTGSGSAV